MSALDEHLRRHRIQIIAREEQAFREVLAGYDEIERDLQRQFRELQKKILEAQANGATISPSWLYREQRLKHLLAQVEDQIIRFGGRVAPIVTREQRAAIQFAVDHSRSIINLLNTKPSNSFSIGSTLSPRVIENAVGMIGDGSPIGNWFKEKLAPAVAEKLKSEIIKAVATGTDFNTIARRLVQVGGITRHRALTMARTEVNRVRRETTRQIYEENSDLIKGWEWVASKSSRTCPACLAQDGKVYKLDVPFPQHWSCRCTMIPVLIDVKRPPRTIGSEWFASQPDEVKEKIIGKEAFDAYARGDVELKDFVGWATSKEFGKRVYTRPLAAIFNAAR